MLLTRVDCYTKSNQERKGESKMFHRHKWEEISRHYTPGVKVHNITNVNDDTADVLEKIIFGFTTVELKCNECGKLDHVIIIGCNLKGD